MAGLAPNGSLGEYETHGTTSLFAAFSIAGGTVTGELHRRHRAAEYEKFLVTIGKAVPAGLDVHIVCGKLSTHKTPEIHPWLAHHPRWPGCGGCRNRALLVVICFLIGVYRAWDLIGGPSFGVRRKVSEILRKQDD